MIRLILNLTAFVTIVWLAMVSKEPKADAYPGAVCYDSTSCARCELCYKQSAFAASGVCLRFHGAYGCH